METERAISKLDVEAYLERLNYSGPIRPDIDTLRELHRAHMLAVPFENLDIHLGQAIALDQGALFDKIVTRRRGGFCYELNGLFCALLSGLGFKVTMLSAGVVTKDGSFGPEFDHMTLMVELEERWLADVGFGDSFIEPLRLDEEGEQAQYGSAYRIAQDGHQRKMLRSDDESSWADQYLFTLLPRRMDDYLEMCHYHQTSPDSHFTRQTVCSLATPEGRISVSGKRLIVTKNRERQESLLEGEAEYAAVLRERFGVEVDVKKLLS